MRSCSGLVPLLFLWLSACASEPIHGNDYRELFVHGRVEVGLGRDRPDAERGAFTHGLELAATGVRGANPTHDFEPGIDRYTLFESSVAWKPTVRLATTASVSGLVGLAYDDVSVDIDSSVAGGASALGFNGPTYGDRALGGLLGVEVRVGLPVVGLYGRATQASDGITTSSVLEAGVEFHPAPALTLQVAYRSWNLQASSLGPTPYGDVDLTVDGVTVGGVLRF